MFIGAGSLVLGVGPCEHPMKFRALQMSIMLGPFLIAGCSSPKGFDESAVLQRQREWPRIRELAEREVAKRKPASAPYDHYKPAQHTNGAWVVIVWADYPEGGYPGNSFKDTMDLVIHDDGTCTSYSVHREYLHFR